MDRKSAVRARLNATSELHSILPTSRLSATRNPQFELVADHIRSGGNAEAAPAAVRQLSRISASVLGAPVLTMSDAPDISEQLSGFARAGILFFEATSLLRESSLDRRRALGGNGAVTRVMTQEGRLLLETPRLIIQFDGAASPQERGALLAEFEVYEILELGFSPGLVLAAPLSGKAMETAVALMEREEILFAEPDFIEHVGKRLAPNDPQFSKQWHLLNSGQTGGTAGADIRATQAWDTTRGEGVRIAVIDNGFDIGHPDLAFGALSGWFRSTADLMDADFVAGIGGMPSDDHGTACAGMCAARGGNGLGGCGVAYASELSVVACLDDQVGSQTTMARAIAYAAKPSLEIEGDTALPGADVIACSLGPDSAAWPLREVMRAAIEFVAAEGRNGLGTPLFWACTNGNFPISADEVVSHPDVIAVGRSTHDDLDDSTGFGPKLEFLAPGVDVYVPAEGGGHQVTTGTSFAAPCAAGVGALVLAANPQLSATEVRRILRDTCDKVGPLQYDDGRNDRFGHGRVNAYKAVQAA